MPPPAGSDGQNTVAGRRPDGSARYPILTLGHSLPHLSIGFNCVLDIAFQGCLLCLGETIRNTGVAKPEEPRVEPR